MEDVLHGAKAIDILCLQETRHDRMLRDSIAMYAVSAGRKVASGEIALSSAGFAVGGVIILSRWPIENLKISVDNQRVVAVRVPTGLMNDQLSSSMPISMHLTQLQRWTWETESLRKPKALEKHAL